MIFYFIFIDGMKKEAKPPYGLNKLKEMSFHWIPSPIVVIFDYHL